MPRAQAGDAGPFPWVHLWRIGAIVLVACVSVGALSAASPVATANAGAIQSLQSFFTQPWSP
ncbi:hypothetical protein E5CHR_05077 [Variovorax sp. PBL-E5]|nr:hypothetical protein E5CHR_05077 [Variovorax sp. PBL-E5]